MNYQERLPTQGDCQPPIADLAIQDLEEKQPPTFSCLPEIAGWEWKKYDRERLDCGTLCWNARERVLEETKERLPSVTSVRAVTENIRPFLERYGREEIAIPKYYSRISEWDPVVSQWTAGRPNPVPGIPKWLLEASIRLATGHGHYNPSDVTVVVCDNNSLVVGGSKGVFIVDAAPVREVDPHPPESAYFDVSGFTIPEEDEQLREGLSRFISFMESHFDIKFTGYSRFTGSKHIFELAQGEEIYVSGEVKRFVKVKTDPQSLTGEYRYEYGDASLKSVWAPSDTVAGVGETYSHYGDGTALGIIDQRVIGYTHDWVENEYVYSQSARPYEVKSVQQVHAVEHRDKYDRFDWSLRKYNVPLRQFKVRGASKPVEGAALGSEAEWSG